MLHAVQVVDDFAEDARLLGKYDYSRQLIKLADRLSEDAATQTLLHEVGHAYQIRCGLDRTNEDHSEIVEALLDSVTTGLMEFFRDEQNNWLTARVLGVSERALEIAREYDSASAEDEE